MNLRWSHRRRRTPRTEELLPRGAEGTVGARLDASSDGDCPGVERQEACSAAAEVEEELLELRQHIDGRIARREVDQVLATMAVEHGVSIGPFVVDRFEKSGRPAAHSDGANHL